MYVPFKYRLYPFLDQEREIMRQLDELKFLWNYALEQRQHSWKLKKESVGYASQCKSLTEWRSNDSCGIGSVYSHVAQECLHRMDRAFKSFFSSIARYPRFKSEMMSLTYPDAYNGSVAVCDGKNGSKRLHLSKIGDVPIEYDRQLSDGMVKTCTVKRDGDRWYAVLTVEVPDVPAQAIATSLSPVGIDLGLNHIAALSTGEMVKAPKFLKRSERSLKRAQRKLSRRVKGSNRWRKQKVVVQKHHAKVRDQRKDFAHKLTTGWAKVHDLIAFEDMDVRRLSGSRLAKSVHDAGWGMLRQMCAYKAPRNGGMYVEVKTNGTTQTCSVCGRVADPPLTLKDRIYRCPCGHTEDRDANASLNILGRALKAVRQGMPESTHVERVASTFPPGRRAVSVKREPPAATEVAF